MDFKPHTLRATTPMWMVIQNLKIKPVVQTMFFVLLFSLVFLSACTPDPDPDCCIGGGDRRDAPFSTTYNFQFKTRASDIVAPNPDRLLRIFSEADILTLIQAASTEQLIENGLIGGQVHTFDGPAREVSLRVTDTDGNLIGRINGPTRNLFYNGLGQVPDLLIDRGTGDEGTFTLFSVPPGDVFFQAEKGGRGNSRITSFKESVSLGRLDVLPVFPDRIEVLGVVSNASTEGESRITNPLVSFFGSTVTVTGNAEGLFILPAELGLPTQGEFLIQLKAPSTDFRETVLPFSTPMADVLSRTQAFDPLTIDRLLLFPETEIQGMASDAGLSLGSNWGIITGRVRADRDGTGQGNASVIAMNSTGNQLNEKDGQQRLFYFNAPGGAGQPLSQSNLDPTLTQTSDHAGFILFVDDCASNKTVFLHGYKSSIDEEIEPALSTGRARAYCEAGKVMFQDIRLNFIPDFTDPPIVTVEITGNIKNENGLPVSGATVSLVGSAFTPQTSSDDTFSITQNIADQVSPVLANSDTTFRVASENHLPTYQKIFSGPEGGKRDLTILQSSMGELCLPSGNLHILGTARNLGLLDPSRASLALEGISVEVVQRDGSPAGRVVYPGGDTKTAAQGQFAVCDLPEEGLYQIKVTSPEDSGTVMVQSHADGVFFMSMTVNKALPKTVTLNGRVKSLMAPDESPTAIGNMNLVVHGTGQQFTSDASGNYAMALGSNGQYILQMEKEGLLPALNYHVETPVQITQADHPPLITLSQEDLETLAGEAGVALLEDTGIVAGKTLSRKFSSSGTAISTVSDPPIGLYSTFMNDDGHVDLLSVSTSGETELYFGDGTGTFTPKSLPCPNLSISPQAAEVRDFNQDGRMDLAVIGDFGFTIFLGAIDGCFERLQTIPPHTPDPAAGETKDPELGGIPQAFSITDLTGDGFFDVLIATAAEPGLTRLVNQRDAVFTPVRMDGSCGAAPLAVVARQSATGLLDIILADAVEGICEITFNTDESAFAPIQLTLPDGVSSAKVIALHAVSLNGDTIPDLLVIHQDGAAVFLEAPLPRDEADGITERPLISAFTAPDGFTLSAALLADIDRDNRNDMIVGGAGGTLTLLGNGDGTFSTTLPVSTSASTHLSLADYNADGKPDLMILESSNLNLFFGENSPISGMTLNALNESGQPVGRLAYMDATGRIQTDATSTNESGRFIFFNVPPGFTQILVTGGGAGNSYGTTLSGGLSYFHVNTSLFSTTQVHISGEVINPTVGVFSGISVEDIQITPLGTGVETFSGPEGQYELDLGANSTFIMKLDP